MNERTIRIGNRISGLCMLAFGAIVSSARTLPLEIAGAIFGVEGLGDLISGEHHYFSLTLVDYISKLKNSRYVTRR